MKIRKSILYYLTELLIVAFGVFLGILVSEYNNSNKLEKNVSKSRELIIKEIESNLVALNDGIRYHETIKVGFDQMRKNLNGEVVLTPYFTNTGFRFEQI